MEFDIISIVTGAILGSGVGYGVYFFLVRYKLYKSKKNMLEDIEKQKDRIFYIPETEEGETNQKMVDLKELVKEPKNYESEYYESEDDDELEFEDDGEEEDENLDDEKNIEELDEKYNNYSNKEN